MKLSIAITSEHALPSAFVVFRGFEESILQAAALGYDGVELALKNAGEINRKELQALLNKTRLRVCCISTGQVYAETGLMFTDVDRWKRAEVRKIFKGMIDLAADFGQFVNIGRARGQIDEEGVDAAEERFVEIICELADYAVTKEVGLLLEPVNRYEINFINSVEEGARLLKKINHPNIKLMPDVFHMNIEDVKIGAELLRHINYIGYIHLADSNRLAPGWGHTDFEDIFNHLETAGYKGWFSVEILPKPEPRIAAKQAIEFLRPFLKK
ncbi:MAG: sugar phosphate isomerase/epimerase [Prevotella sp.]|jgi:sugar phosphate isomerase/epimerase|nr:sugar phosphate isomerase/epimerase [Prevotella sp.]